MAGSNKTAIPLWQLVAAFMVIAVAYQGLWGLYFQYGFQGQGFYTLVQLKWLSEVVLYSAMVFAIAKWAVTKRPMAKRVAMALFGLAALITAVSLFRAA